MRRFVFYIVWLVTLTTGHAQSYPQRTDVPSVYIETENGSPITSKEQFVNCTFIYVDGDSVGRYENTQIRGRGNSTWWNSDKKPYRVKFEKKQQLLGDGFANARNWTLLANHGDKTMIRNALTYDLGRFMGMRFCPSARFIDLYLNGNYQGTYQISDHVQVHEGRIEIDKDNGWLLEVANENSKEDPFISSSTYKILYNLKNPKDEQLTVNKRIAIGQWIQQFESVVASDDFMDPEKGWRTYLDEYDFVNWYVGAEITGNIDALYSIYMYKDADEDRMHFGPLWDLDLGYDNSSERSLLYNLEAFLGLWNRPFENILQRLWQDPRFAQACNDRLQELTDRGLQQYLISHIDSLRTAIWQTQTENFKKWRINQKVYDWAKHSYYNNYDAYISDLKSFVSIHIPYLQQAFAERVTTGIRLGHGRPDSDKVYDLNGRPSLRPHKGIYIQNHRKVIHN